MSKDPTDQSEKTERASVSRDIDLEVPAADVWDALADDDLRSAWMGGTSTIDVAPGGGGRAIDEDGTTRSVRVTEVEPGRRLSFDWWEDDEGGPGEPSRVSFVVTPTPGGSHLRVTETYASAAAPTARLSARTLDLEWLLIARMRCNV